MVEIIRKDIGSDFSGQEVPEAEAVQVHVLSHPDTPEAPTVRVDGTKEEADALRKLAIPAVRLLIVKPGEEAPEELAVEAKKFDTMFRGVGKKAVEVLAEAPVVGKRIRASSGNGEGETGRDYASPDWAGTPKKGKTSPEERAYVAGNLDAVNERLARDGMRLIDLNNSEHVARYGLENLAAARKANSAASTTEQPA